MRTRSLVLVGGLVLLGLSACALALGAHQPLVRWGLERALNRATAELFHGSLRLKRASLDRRLRLSLDELRGTLSTAHGPVPVAIWHVETGPLWRALQGQEVVVRFAQAGVQSAAPPGASGILRVVGGRAWRWALEAEVTRLDVQDLAWISPSHVAGCAGRLTGTLRARTAADGRTTMAADMKLEEPGGVVQARLFDLLLPYVPNASEIARISAQQAVVEVRDARLTLTMERSDQLNLLFHAAVPSYNVVVNVRMDVHVDAQRPMELLARWLRAGPA